MKDEQFAIMAVFLLWTALITFAVVVNLEEMNETLTFIAQKIGEME